MSEPSSDTTTTTASGATRVIGAAALALLVPFVLLAFVGAPEDDLQGDTVRIIFVHVPSAILTYVCFSITAIGSVMWLWKRSVWWDMTAHAAAEIGVLFCGLTLFTGAVWGRPTWGTYWEWGDVRLVTTLILFLIMVGYLSVRSIGGDDQVVATRAAVVGLIGAINLPIVNRSVEWWFDRTLHQQSSLTDGKLEGLTLFTLVLGFAIFALVTTWMMIHRFRIAWLERQERDLLLDDALADRRAEALTAQEGSR